MHPCVIPLLRRMQLWYEEQDAYLYTAQGKPLLSTELKVRLNLHPKCKHGLFTLAALAADSYGMLLGQYYPTLISPDCQVKHSTALCGIIIHSSATGGLKGWASHKVPTNGHKTCLTCYHRHSPGGGHHLAQTSLWQSTAVRHAWRCHVAPHRTAPQCHLCKLRGANTYVKIFIGCELHVICHWLTLLYFVTEQEDIIPSSYTAAGAVQAADLQVSSRGGLCMLGRELGGREERERGRRRKYERASEEERESRCWEKWVKNWTEDATILLFIASPSHTV